MEIDQLDSQKEHNDTLDSLLISPENIYDPENMDAMLIYLEQQMAEDEEYMELLKSRLKDVFVTWEQPWYQQVNSLTRPMNIAAPDGEEYLKDSISMAEGEKIKKNWRKFTRKYEIPDTPICFVRWKSKGKSRNPKRNEEERIRQLVTAFLAKGLQRTRKQVYDYFNSQFGCPNKGHYTKTEEKLMEICFYHKPKEAVPYLSSILGREPRGIYKKLHEAHHGKAPRKRIKWDINLATKFLNLLLKYTGMRLEDLKNNQIEKEVWLKLEEEFEQQYVYLQRFWYLKLHVQIFVRKNVKIKRLRKIILRKLLNFPYKIWSDIRWKEVLKEFPDGFTKAFLYHVIYKTIIKVPKYYRIPLPELVDSGIAVVNSRRHVNKRLKSLAFNENHELEEVNYDEKF